MTLCGSERSKTGHFYGYLCCLLLMSVVVLSSPGVRSDYIHIGICSRAAPFGKELFTRLIGCNVSSCNFIHISFFRDQNFDSDCASS